MYIERQKCKLVYTAMSKESECERRRLPSLPYFRYNNNLAGAGSIQPGSSRAEKESSLRRFSSSNREASKITEEIVNIIRLAEAEETRQVKMASVDRQENFNCSFQRQTSNNNIAVVEGTSQRIAGIIDLFQDNDGCWIRKIEITKVPGQGLGFFIKKGNGFDRKNGVFISRVSLGSVLDINGLLHSGDEVLEVNRVNLRGFPLKDVALMMQIPDKLLLTTKSHIPVNRRTMTWGALSVNGAREGVQSSPGTPSRNIETNQNRYFVRSQTDAKQSRIFSRSLEEKSSFAQMNESTSSTQPSKTQSQQVKVLQMSNKEVNQKSNESFDLLKSDRTASPRSLPDVPMAKSPRKLPTPPLGPEDDNTSRVSGSTPPTSQADQDVLSSSPNSFKRAELYRVQTSEPEISNDSPETALNTTEESSPPEILSSDKSSEKKAPAEKETRKATSETSKSSNRLGFFRSLSTKDVKKETKNELAVDRVFEPYKSENLNSEMDFSRAYSGMLAVHIVKIENMQKSSKEKKCYCTIEVDDEFQASTSKKKFESSNNLSFDEQFDIEISQGSEVTIYVFSIGSGKQHSLASSGVIFLERMLSKTTSRSIALELENSGVLYMTLDFTEARKYLKRTPSSRKSGVFGFNIISTLDDEKNTIPIIVRKCVDEIEARGMSIVGLYRISGNAKKKKILKAEFDQDSHSVDVSAKNGVDCNVLTGILKDYLRELPEPLIPVEVFDKINDARAADASPDLSRRQQIFSELLKLLHYGSRATLIYIMDHLIRVEEQKEVNKMDLTNLAVCFGPVLLCPPTTTAVLDFRRIIEALEFLLKIWPKRHEQGVEIEITSM